LKMGPISCPETSVRNCFSTLRNIPGERRSNTVYVWKRLGEKVGTTILSVAVQRPGHEIEHLPPSGAESENERSFICFCSPACRHGMEKNFFILISIFRRVLNVVCFLLGDSPASEIYMPTFRNTPPVPSS